MLDKDILNQVRQIFEPISKDITLHLLGPEGADETRDMREFLDDVASCSPRISVAFTPAAGEYMPRFNIATPDGPTGIAFRGIPNGHEFSSLLLAIMNTAGLGRNLPDEATRARIRALKGAARLRLFVSLECTNCPDVVQALNVVALLASDVSCLTIDGAVEQESARTLGVQSVPTVFIGDEILSVGRADLGELLAKLEEHMGSDKAAAGPQTREFDAVVVGGGPAGAAASIYLARKGLRTAVVAGRIGGQVRDTMEIENVISVPLTTGPRLADDLRTHMERAGAELFADRRVSAVDFSGPVKSVTADSGETFTARAVVLATGAAWRKLNVPGEADYLGRGVAFCTHCDGPFYAGKRVAVVGGGNSGVEAAIDLAGICEHVDLYEFLDTLKADHVLQTRLHSLPNVDVHLSSAVRSVSGDGKRLTGIDVEDRNSGAVAHVAVDGVFVQIGLTPQTEVFQGSGVELSHGEIVVDRCGRTTAAGVFAAGDATDVPYKQIIIAMGEGAKAALSAFDYLMRL